MRSPVKLSSVGLVLAGSWLLAASAQIEVPLWPVPMTGQTLVVLCFAALAGAPIGAAAVVAYVLQGALGLPFFAGGASGWVVLIGPTGGYLLGFVFAAVLAGARAPRVQRFPGMLALMALGHLVVLVPGVGRLALSLGPAEAVQRGFGSLLPGAVLKTVLAAGVVWALRRGRSEHEAEHVHHHR